MKRFLNILLRVFIILIVLIVMVVAGGAAYVLYVRAQKESTETITISGDKQVVVSKKIELEPTITCLFMGRNQGLTDFIMLGKYDPNTREVNLMSIPRDTKIGDGMYGKINSLYAKGLNPMNTVNKVTEITGVEIDYYVLFSTNLLRELVDEIDGVTVTVPINMNYDDPYQDLYIHLKKGTYKLNGKQAEQFCRFRKNNNGTGYPDGDVGRVKAQQSFIKAMIARCLEPQNLLKAKKLVDIVLKDTKTNITQELAMEYIDDAVAFKPDRVRMETLPGQGGYATDGISYFFMDKEKSKELINELFNQETNMEEVMEIQEEIEREEKKKEEKEAKKEIIVRERKSGDSIRIEVLNNGTSVSNFNKTVELLNGKGYDVVKVGKKDDTKNELSKIICYSPNEEMLEVMQDISKVVGINKLENSEEGSADLDFTVILGPKYVAE